MPIFLRSSSTVLGVLVLASSSALGACSSDTPGDGGSGGTGTGSTTTATTTTASTTTSSGSTSGSSTGGLTADCTSFCERGAECSAAIMVPACVSSCEAETPMRRDCVFACDRTDCPAFLECVTACGADHNGNNPYGACTKDGPGPDCPANVARCFTNEDDLTGALLDSVCVPSCLVNPCPAPLSGTAVPTCSPTDVGACYLDCANGALCPDGMTCLVIDDVDMCVWPN